MNGSQTVLESFSGIRGFAAVKTTLSVTYTVLDGLGEVDQFLVVADVTSVGGHVGSVKNVRCGSF